MRKQVSWLILLLLTGCQLTHPVDDTPSTNSTQTDTSAAASKTEQSQDITQPVVESKPDPLTQENLWKRITLQFSLPIPQDNEAVNYYRTWYLKHPKHLAIVAERARPFLYLITEKVEQHKLPLELTLLPVVESAFDVFAYSYGRAAGIWQFVPATGKLYGLKQNYWYDGRRDVDAATEAAMNYLTRLGKNFHGNWEQAIAAYNAGSGTILRAIRRNKEAHRPTDFFSLDLPDETSSYVPKLLALAEIFANPEKYGVKIPSIPNKPFLQRVTLDRQLDLAVAAKYADISIKKLQMYNPAFNRWATTPNGSYTLLLPIDHVEAFETALENNKGKGIKLVRYQVKPGDNLDTIAKQYNTTAGVIKTANSLDNNLIRVKQYLMIPTSVKDEKTYTMSVANRLARIQSQIRGQYKMVHTVMNGESLWTIARKYDVTTKAIAKWNGMSPKDPLKVGRDLVIWKDSSNGAVIRSLVYQVKEGDTLSDIATRYKVNVSDIIEWNDLANHKYLKPGQRLKLYVDVTKVSSV